MKHIQLISIMLILSTCGNETVVSTLPDPVPDQENTFIRRRIILNSSRRYIYWVPRNH